MLNHENVKTVFPNPNCVYRLHLGKKKKPFRHGALFEASARHDAGPSLRCKNFAKMRIEDKRNTTIDNIGVVAV